MNILTFNKTLKLINEYEKFCKTKMNKLIGGKMEKKLKLKLKENNKPKSFIINIKPFKFSL